MIQPNLAGWTPNQKVLEGFECKEKGELRLYYPKPGTDGLSNSIWTLHTVHYRSRIEDQFGLLVSAGFPKFFNLGCGPERLRVEAHEIIRAAEEHRLLATLKMDGSLLIRSVYKGKVMLRTRGSFGYEHLDNAHEMEIFAKKYPRLMNPSTYMNMSLLFEWTSPNNVIVLKYPEPELTLIGAVFHWSSTTYATMTYLEQVSMAIQVPIVKYFPVSKSGWEDLQAMVETEQTIEGYVLRLHGEQCFVKIKCKPYLTRHALKSKLSTEKLVDMWFEQSRPDFVEFSENFVKNFDEETYIWAIGAISNFFDGLKVYEKIESAMRMKAKSRATWTRKDAALAGIDEYGQTKRFSMYIKMWANEPLEEDLVKSIILQNTKQTEVDFFKPTQAFSEQED